MSSIYIIYVYVAAAKRGFYVTIVFNIKKYYQNVGVCVSVQVDGWRQIYSQWNVFVCFFFGAHMERYQQDLMVKLSLNEHFEGEWEHNEIII